MARRRHVMTARRKVALRKAQMASARRRKGRGRSHLSPRTRRNIKRTAIGVGVLGAAVGTGIVVHDRSVNVRVYHNTPNENLPAIRKSGLVGVKVGSFSNRVFNEQPGTVFVSKGRNTTKQFGDGTVKIKMRRSEFRRAAHRDPHLTTNRRAYAIPQQALTGKKLKTRQGGFYRKLQYEMYFPKRTKESYIGLY